MEPEEQEGKLTDTLAQLISFALRRRWWILLPTCVVSLAVIAVLWMIPNRYTSSATLLVIQQQVPERFVASNSTADLRAALEAMKQDILSRTRLLKLIEDFGLYPELRNRLAPEQLVALALKNIGISPITSGTARRQRDGEFDAIQISFTTESPVLAQQVANTLTSLFTSEYLKNREAQSTNTTRFLREQVEEKRKQLGQQEELLRQFKLSHVGELPEQQQGNLGILTGLQGQLQNTMASLNRAQQQRTYLESLLNAHLNQPAPGEPDSPVVVAGRASAAPTPLEVAQNTLTQLQTSRAALISRYTPDHPDVLKADREIARAEELVNRLKTTAGSDTPRPAAGRSGAPARVVSAADATSIAQLRSQLEANRLEIDNLARDEKRLKASISVYENRLNQTPVREQQQAGIMRETEALRAEFDDLQKKEQESQLATNLERQQGGQQFRLVDPASLPNVPSSPKRLKMSFGGIAAGLFIGLALAFFVETKLGGFYTEKDLTQAVATPIMVSIPLLRTSVEEQRRTWKIAVEWVAGSVMVVALLVAEFFVYRAG